MMTEKRLIFSVKIDRQSRLVQACVNSESLTLLVHKRFICVLGTCASFPHFQWFKGSLRDCFQDKACLLSAVHVSLEVWTCALLVVGPLICLTLCPPVLNRSSVLFLPMAPGCHLHFCSFLFVAGGVAIVCVQVVVFSVWPTAGLKPTNHSCKSFSWLTLGFLFCSMRLCTIK